MMLLKRTFNPAEAVEDRKRALSVHFEKLRYSGNPEHKRNPGHYGLVPPSTPGPGKTLCDQVKIYSRSEALALLREGFQRRTFSLQERGGWPQNVWAVTEQGEPLEAQLENQGAYHGYPMPEADPFREKVFDRWRSS